MKKKIIIGLSAGTKRILWAISLVLMIEFGPSSVTPTPFTALLLFGLLIIPLLLFKDDEGAS